MGLEKHVVWLPSLQFAEDRHVVNHIKTPFRGKIPLRLRRVTLFLIYFLSQQRPVSQNPLGR